MRYLRLLCWYWFLAPQFWGAVIGGVASLLGGKKANDANSAQSLQQMEFQKGMSDTAHQREVLDLQKAGLNPILSGTGGPGASSPPGASAKINDEYTPAVNTALAAYRGGNEAKIMKQEKLNKESEGKILAEKEIQALWDRKAAFNHANNLVHNGFTAYEQSKQMELLTERDRLDTDIRKAQQAGRLDGARLESSSAGDLKRRSDMGADSLGNWVGAVNPFVTRRSRVQH